MVITTSNTPANDAKYSIVCEYLQSIAINLTLFNVNGGLYM